MSVMSLIEDLRERAAASVSFHHWDPYILGTDHALRRERLTAGEVAFREEDRWSRGRFPSLAVAVADAVFSKQRKYPTAVKTMARPFALKHGHTDAVDLVELGWARVFVDVFEGSPRSSETGRPHHLTLEGRIYSIVAALRQFVDHGIGSLDGARAWARSPTSHPVLTRRLHDVPGIREAMVQNIRMNLGALILKLDVHVRRVLAEHLPVSATAPASDFAACLRDIAPDLPWSAFQIDQIIWYTEASRARGSQAVEACAS